MNEIPATAEAPCDADLAALMVAYQDGSLAAFEQLYGALAKPMRGYFRARVGTEALVADLVQDTFLELHRSRRTYQPGRPVRAWAFGIAHHVLLRHRDGERRRARHESTSWTGDPVPQLAESLEPDLRELERALRALSPGTREAWLQHHVEGRGFAEIAATLGIAATAARLRASRASAAIRRALGLNGGTTDD